MRRLIGIIQPLFLATVGVALIVTSGAGFWFWFALGVWLVGFAIWTAAVNRAWAGLRRRAGVSVATGLRVAFSLYILAGAMAGFAGLIYLERAGAVIAAFFALCWVVFWSEAFRRAQT
jgi:hypothetical protein